MRQAVASTAKLHLAAKIPLLDVYFSFTEGDSAGDTKPLWCPTRGASLLFLDLGQYRRFEVTRISLRPQLHGHLRSRSSTETGRIAVRPARQLNERKFIVAVRNTRGMSAGRGMSGTLLHLSPRWHAQFYSSSNFTLNLTRRDMSLAGCSPSVRLFEAAACGCAIISTTGLASTLSFRRERNSVTGRSRRYEHYLRRIWRERHPAYR